MMSANYLIGNLHYLRGNLHCFHLLLGRVGKSMYYVGLQVEQLGRDASVAWHPSYLSSSTASKAEGTACSISHYNLLVTASKAYLLFCMLSSSLRRSWCDLCFIQVLKEVGSHSFKGFDVLTVTTKFREYPFLVTVLATLGSDASIRKRALKLGYLLINETNVKPLTKGLIDYLEVSDQDFKGDLTAKICSIVEKLSPDKLWYIDQMLKVLCEAGNYVKDKVWHALVVITNASNLHRYTVWLLYRAIQTSVDQQLLGLEYGALENMVTCW
ncbi:AP-1 complex subunit gamma-2-like protein isoform X1 [Tanacetum coccineum]